MPKSSSLALGPGPQTDRGLRCIPVQSCHGYLVMGLDMKNQLF